MILYNLIEDMVPVHKEKVFLQICKELGIQTKKLREEDKFRTVAELCGIDNMGLCVDRTHGSTIDEDLPELLILKGLDDVTFDKFLDMYKANGLKSVDLKAVVTPINMAWTLETLVVALQEEHAIMNKNK